MIGEPSDDDWGDEYLQDRRRRPARVAIALILVLAAVMLGLVAVDGGGAGSTGLPSAHEMR